MLQTLYNLLMQQQLSEYKVQEKLYLGYAPKKSVEYHCSRKCGIFDISEHF
jgi:hypothetical protein